MLNLPRKAPGAKSSLLLTYAFCRVDEFKLLTVSCGLRKYVEDLPVDGDAPNVRNSAVRCQQRERCEGLCKDFFPLRFRGVRDMCFRDRVAGNAAE